MAPRVDCVAATCDVLGESAIWSPSEHTLYWADLFKPAVNRLDPQSGAVTTWIPPEKLGCLVMRAKGGLLLAGRSGFAAADPESGRFNVLHNPEADRPRNILNDGKCDRRGRLWIGSMDRQLTGPTGRLHCLHIDQTSHVVREGLWIPNSIAFSPDDRVLYLADTHLRAIYAYDFDIDEGLISNGRQFVSLEHQPGEPDGSTVDEDGCLWNAQWGGGRVVRYTPEGRIDQVVELPVSRTTSCAFGGPRLDTLFVTTATFRLTDEERARQPWAGGLLAVDVGVRGLPEPPYGG